MSQRFMKRKDSPIVFHFNQRFVYDPDFITLPGNFDVIAYQEHMKETKGKPQYPAEAFLKDQDPADYVSNTSNTSKTAINIPSVTEEEENDSDNDDSVATILVSRDNNYEVVDEEKWEPAEEWDPMKAVPMYKMLTPEMRDMARRRYGIEFVDNMDRGTMYFYINAINKAQMELDAQKNEREK